MVKSEAQRQKILARKRAKKNSQRATHMARKQQLKSLAGQMLAASSGQIVGCYRGDSSHLERNGVNTVLLARRGPDGFIAFAHFMLDFWCFGVKDCYGRLVTPEMFRDTIAHIDGNLSLTSVSPSTGLAMVESALAYARSLGIKPPSDFEKVSQLWGKTPVGEMPPEIELGRNGRPCYIVGPFDDQAKQILIQKSLDASVGRGNYDVVAQTDLAVDSHPDFDLGQPFDKLPML